MISLQKQYINYMPKHLLNKKQVLETLNPVLGPNDYIKPSTVSGSCNNNELPPEFVQNMDQCTDMYDKPAWLREEDDVIMRDGDRLSIGAYYINGHPITSWGARVGGTSTQAYRHNQMQNFYTTQQIKQKLFPDGIQAYLNNTNKNFEEIDITKLKIINMQPGTSGIGLDITVVFTINDLENDYWGKFINYGIDLKPKFNCQEIETYKHEIKIKIEGKIKNKINEFFKPKQGIYQLQSAETIVYTEYGQIKKLKEGDVVEVYYVDDDKIKIQCDYNKYIIKKPTYFWFNWHFKKQ